METPLISVIIPLYNAGKYISAAVESVLDQTWKHIEIIVVDDGSTDDSLQAVKQYEHLSAVKIFSRTNAGACAARNFGFLQSSGEYIQYLDADDLLAADKIYSQIRLLQPAGPEVISSCGWAHFTSNTNEAIFSPQDIWKNMKPIDWLISAWKGGGMMQTACWLTPRSLHQAAGLWNENLRRNPADDGEFFCRVLIHCREIIFQPDARVYYRKHAGMRVSATNNREAVASLLGTYISYEKNILAKEHSSRVVEALAHNYASFMIEFFDIFPDLAKAAEKNIYALGIDKLPLAGGKNFMELSKLTGVKNALFLKSLSGRVRRSIGL